MQLTYLLTYSAVKIE